MIAWLKGNVIDIDGNEIVINTGNIGYRVFIGENRLLEMGVRIDSEIEIVIYTSVKDDEIKLFGFDSFFSRKIFTLLLGVNGVGPKAAINIVDQLEPGQVLSSIRDNDIYPFIGVSGIGKKTAQRIILDLQGKIGGFEYLMKETKKGQQLVGGGTENGGVGQQAQLTKDARSAMENLGFSEREADRVIRKHIGPGVKLDEIIRKCLADLRQ